MRIQADKLESHLQRRPLAPCYLVAGPETLLREESIDAIRGAARAAGIEEREVLVADQQFDWQALANAGMEPSLFASRRLIELRLPTGKPGQAGARALGEWLGSDNEDVLLVACDQWDLASERSAWAKKLIEAGVYVPVWQVKPGQLPGWIRTRMRAHRLEPDDDAVQRLAERVDGNLLAADQEIQQLALVRGAGPVTGAEIESQVVDSARFSAFRLCAALLQGHSAESLRVTASLRRAATPEALVIGALTREFATLNRFIEIARASSMKVAFDQLKIWKSRQDTLRQAARRLGQRRTQRLVARLARLDRLAKGRAAGDFWVELDELVIAACDRA